MASQGIRLLGGELEYSDGLVHRPGADEITVKVDADHSAFGPQGVETFACLPVPNTCSLVQATRDQDAVVELQSAYTTGVATESPNLLTRLSNLSVLASMNRWNCGKMERPGTNSKVRENEMIEGKPNIHEDSIS